MSNHYDDDDVSCETCGQAGLSGTKRCNNCWEVEKRLATYVTDGGDLARAFVTDTLIASLDLTDAERAALKRIWSDIFLGSRMNHDR